MEKKQYICPKCGCTQYESDQFQATGGNFAKQKVRDGLLRELRLYGTV